MPHKKAKRSVREEARKQHGSNLAPVKVSIANEEIPKSVSRVLNAFKIREEYNKKRKLQQDEFDPGRMRTRNKKDNDSLRIKPGEPIQHFYRRVEDDMRPLVRSAVQTSKAVERKARKAELKTKGKRLEATDGKPRPLKSDRDVSLREQSPPTSSSATKQADSKKDNPPKEFETLPTSTPRRLNDIVQAPPEIKRIPRGATAGGKREGVLSMVQKAKMEDEREKAIARYRMLKASRSQVEKGKET